MMIVIDNSDPEIQVCLPSVHDSVDKLVQDYF